MHLSRSRLRRSGVAVIGTLQHLMSEISVTLPDGSIRRVPAGSTPADVAAVISPRLAKAAIAAVVDGRRSISRSRSRSDAARRDPHGPRRDALHVYRHSTAHLLAAAVTNLFPARSAASARRPTRASTTTSSSQRPFVPEDLEAIEKKMKELAAQDLRLRAPDVAAPGSDRLLHEARRAAQGAVDRGEDGGPGRGLRATRSRIATRSSTSASARTCRRPDRLKAFKLLDARRTRTGRATRRTSRCSASTARRSSARRSCRRTCSGSRKRRSATTARSARSSACSRSIRGRRAPRSGCRRARRSTTRSRTTCATCCSPPATSR